MTTHVHVEERTRPRAGTDVVVGDVRRPHVYTYRIGDTLDRPARLMWDHDCGAIPIVDARGHFVGMVTDRDICMAAYTRGEALSQVPVTVAGSHRIHSVPPEASIALAEEVMVRHPVRRLPVLDAGGNLVGILSLADIVRNARSLPQAGDPLDPEHVAAMMVELFRPSCPQRPQPKGCASIRR